jgi:uncharacterized protein YxeA
MFLKTNIPETTLSLVGVGVDFGDRMFDHSILNDRANQIQAIVSGNRCGHVPDAPRFFIPPDHHKRRPTVLDRAIDTWEVVYRKAKKFFKKLATSHDNGRQVRSERREAIAAVSQVLLHYLELSTLRVGFYIGLNKFIHLDIEYIAKKANLSFSRAKRAITALADAGYIKITRQYKKKEDGTFDGEPSIREISVQFFIDLGMDVQKLFFARDWKRKKEEKAQAKGALKKLKGIMQAVTSFGGHIIPSTKKRHGTSSIDQNLISKALALHQANPERSPTDYLKELQRLKE